LVIPRTDGLGGAFDALQSLVASAIETLAIYPVHFQFQFQAMRAETSPT
jgi:hypothetical protein